MSQSTRRNFLKLIGLAGTGAVLPLSALASSTPPNLGPYELASTEFEVKEALRVFDYKKEVEAEGLELCPPLPEGSDLYGDGLEGVKYRQGMFWACLISPKIRVTFGTDGQEFCDRLGREIREAVFSLWRRSAKPAVYLERDLGEPFTFITDPTCIQDEPLDDWVEVQVFIHISKGLVCPHPGYSPTPADLMTCAEWIAGRLLGLPSDTQAHVMGRLKGQNAVLHALTKFELQKMRNQALRANRLVARVVDYIQPPIA